MPPGRGSGDGQVVLIGGECPEFLKALTRFASRPVRNRASLGGYLAVASDTGQLTPLLIALDARVILLSSDGERDAPIYHFYEGAGKTILRPGEIIRCIIIPRNNRSALAARGMTSRICDTYTVGPRRNLCEPFVTGAFAMDLRLDRLFGSGRPAGPGPPRRGSPCRKTMERGNRDRRASLPL